MAPELIHIGSRSLWLPNPIEQAFTITSTVLSLVLIMISIILAVPASRDVILDKVSADWAGWAYILAIGQVVWLAQEFLINLSRVSCLCTRC